MRVKLQYVVVLLVIVALLSGGATYVTVMNAHPEWKKLKAVYATLDEDFYEDVDRKKLFDGAVNGMMKALEDPYSVYMDAQEAQGFQENITSSFVGIGAEIQEQDGRIVIVSPFKGSPAEKAGLKPNDAVLKVGETSLVGLKASEAVKHLRGEKGTKAELTIGRPGESEELKITVIRDTIPIETVYSEMKEGNIGVIQIAKVSETTGNEFAKALKDLKDKGMKGLVIDLRQNPGGLLNISMQIAEMIVPEGKPILQVEYGDGKTDAYNAKPSKHPDAVGLPMAALIDEGTASAGEILAAALQESAGVKLVGQNTFGKGTVQTTTSFQDGSNIKYTIAKWLTPNKNWIHKTGIKPDVEVMMPEYANAPYVDPEKEFKADTFSNEVKSIQLILEALGHTPGRTDGYFDSKTKAAVEAFQKAQGQPLTGIVQGRTTQLLMEKAREQLKANDPQLDAAVKLLREG